MATAARQPSTTARTRTAEAPPHQPVDLASLPAAGGALAVLRPMMLDDLGLNAAMEWLACNAGRRLGLTVTLQLDEVETGLDESTTLARYRIVQEALACVAQLAGARDASITMQRFGNELRLSLPYSGTDWPLQAPTGDAIESIRPLRKHARLSGGRLAVHRLPGGGQRITLGLPMPGIDTSPAHLDQHHPE